MGLVLRVGLGFGLALRPGLVGLALRPGLVGLALRPGLVGLALRPGLVGLKLRPGLVGLKLRPGLVGLALRPGLVGLALRPGLGLGLALLGRTTAALLVALQAPGLMSCCCAPAQRAWHELLYVLPLAHTGMYSMVQMQPGQKMIA
jgi:hypothetical protein